MITTTFHFDGAHDMVFIVKAKAIKASWTIPEDCRLPDSVAAIEAGREPTRKQGELFDDSTMQRLRAIKQGEVAR